MGKRDGGIVTPAWPKLNGRAAVTGGAGFIGSHLVDHLVQLGHDVAVLDNFSSGRRDNLAQSLGHIRLIEGDVRDEEAVRQALHGCRVVFHLAAVVSVPQSVEDPVTTHDVTVGGSVRVLTAARELGVERVIMASSSAVYGENEITPKTESLAASPTSPYGAAKLAMEGFGQAFAASYGLHVTSLRYFNVYGARQDPSSQYAAVVPRFIDALLSGSRPVIYGDGSQTRDFIHVDDVVRANLRAASSPAGAGEVFNIAGGSPHTVLGLCNLLCAITGSAAAPVFEEPRPGDILHSHADIGRASTILGFQPRVDLQEGLTRTVEWFAHHARRGHGGSA